ncbi:hypothetical protein HYV88_00040 [Candidatus Woesearchaeota archaeon]|nr:hypothetical protein [Candidatus Woesearchaeota archaeon]
MEKRGVSIFVFTIMFTLIAGAIILVFFFNFGKDLISFSNKETKVENLLILEKNLASFALSSNSEKSISFSDNSKIGITCDNSNKKLFLSSHNGEYSKEIKKLIFLPFNISSNEVEAWTLAWNYPFKIDNLYFVADNDVTFYFPEISPGSKAEYFINKFKQTKFKFSPSQPTSRLDKGVVIYFNTPPRIIQGNNVKIVSFENIDSNEPKVKFKKEGSWSSYFPIYGDAMLYAAIFSADEKKFSCILNGLAKERVSNLVEIYKDTVEKLKRAEECQDPTNYNNIGTELDKLSNQFGLSTDPRAYEPAKRIKELNDNLKTTNCPILYKSSETMRLL